MSYRSKTEQFTPDSSFAIPVPSGVVNDDFILFAAVSDGGDASCGVPTGFTKLYDINSTADAMCFTVGYKVAASEGATFEYNTAGGITVVCGVWAYSGRASATPVSASSQNNSNTLNASPWSVNATGITPADNNCDLLWVCGHDVNSTNAITTLVAGYTVRSDGGDGFRKLTVADSSQTTAAATGTVTGIATCIGASAGWGVALMAVKPAAGGGGGFQAAWARNSNVIIGAN